MKMFDRYAIRFVISAVFVEFYSKLKKVQLCFIDLFGSLYVVCIMKNLIFFLLSALFNICQVDNSKRVECFVRVKHY